MFREVFFRVGLARIILRKSYLEIFQISVTYRIIVATRMLAAAAAIRMKTAAMSFSRKKRAVQAMGISRMIGGLVANIRVKLAGRIEAL